ncbi:MAG: membrane protein of unknown function [Candidatus Thorarchaeota archaeon]|nr:MAG: membrane protein of unknown function [Candidatus Thorarchaeota archaeon]
MVSCYYHPDRETPFACNRCTRPICEECQLTVNGIVICPDCDKGSTSRNESMLWGTLGVMVLITIDSASYFVFFFTGVLIHTILFKIAFIVGSSLLFAALIHLRNEHNQDLFVASGLLIFLYSLFSFAVRTPTDPESMFLALSSMILFFSGFIILGRAFLEIYRKTTDPKLTKFLGRYLVLFPFAWIILALSMGIIYFLSVTLNFILPMVGYVLLLTFFMKESEENKTPLEKEN